MSSRRSFSFTRLELLPAIGVILVAVCLFSPLWRIAAPVVDFVSWPRGAWIFVNMAVIGALLWAWFGPALLESRNERKPRRAVDREAQEKEKELAEQRKLFERMREARKRQIV